MSFPGGAEQREGLFRQRDVTVFGALASVDMALEAWAIEVGALEGAGGMKPTSQAVDGGEVDLVVPRVGGLEETPPCFNTEDGRETGCGVSAHEREGVPSALADVWIEESEATGADAQGRGSEAIDVFAVQEGGLAFR